MTPSELAQIMRGLGDKLSDEEIELLVKVADKDGDGTISIQEWATTTIQPSLEVFFSNMEVIRKEDWELYRVTLKY